ncbi:MAG TPA: hypothetical protein VN455_03110 [Methanotrichaceae archaeon]|nr:hypothetical protein [Methanotrichaceae archaeon]
MGSAIAADQPNADLTKSSGQMASLNQFEVFAKRVMEINFTWNKNELADPGLSAGNVGGGNMSSLVKALEEDGFDVQQGRVINMDFLSVVNQGLATNANANNAYNPYKTFIFPPLASQSAHPFADINGWSPLYKLRPDEAIVYVGLTPPQSAYFSYQTFLFIHYYPGEGGYKKVAANVGDNINLLTAKTNGTSGDPFSKAILLVSTADKGVNERIKAAAQSAKYPTGIMNTEPLPYPLLRMGYGNTSDFYNFAMRVALFKDNQTQKAYADSIPGVILRVTPKSSTKLDTFGMPALRVRGTGNLSEFELMGTMDALREAILKKYGAKNATELETHQWLFDGYDAIQRGVDMVMPSRDTIYLNTTPFILSNDSSDFAIVYGINHAAIGKTLYSNFNIYGVENLNGVAGINSNNLSGSADEYLPDNPDARYFYVWKVARHCNGEPHCLEVPYDVGAYGINLNQTAFMGFRAYVEPQTKVGPSYNEIVYDRVIKFSPHN